MFIEIDDRGFWNLDLLVHYATGKDGTLTLDFAVEHVAIKLRPDHPQYGVVTRYLESRAARAE